MKLSNSLYNIEIEEDTTYRLFSVDNKEYNLVCLMDDYTRNSHYKTLSINILDVNNISKNIAVVCGFYSYIVDNFAVLNGNELAVLTQDTVAIFDLQKVELLHKNKFISIGTAFHIYPFRENYVIHGELEIVLINKKAEIIWSFSGRDIFVLPNNKKDLKVFTIHDKYIVCYDWNGNKYVLDEKGKMS